MLRGVVLTTDESTIWCYCRWWCCCYLVFLHSEHSQLNTVSSIFFKRGWNENLTIWSYSVLTNFVSMVEDTKKVRNLTALHERITPFAFVLFEPLDTSIFLKASVIVGQRRQATRGRRWFACCEVLAEEEAIVVAVLSGLLLASNVAVESFW